MVKEPTATEAPAEPLSPPSRMELRDQIEAKAVLIDRAQMGDERRAELEAIAKEAIAVADDPLSDTNELLQALSKLTKATSDLVVADKPTEPVDG